MEELVCDIRFVVDWDRIVLVGILLFTINHLTSMTALSVTALEHVSYIIILYIPAFSGS
jgi:hypothetical protein